MVSAMQWVTQITTVSLEMALPPSLGYWADKHWQTEPWLVSLGAVLGFWVGMRHLLQMTKMTNTNHRTKNSGQSETDSGLCD